MDKQKNKYYHDKRWFGGHRDDMLKRDGYKCVLCGSLDIVGHHKDGKGRRHPNPNSALDNLQTLCRSCHRRLHASAQITAWVIGQVMENWDRSDSGIAALVGLSHPTVKKIRKQVLEILDMTPPKSTATPEQRAGNGELLKKEAK